MPSKMSKISVFLGKFSTYFHKRNNVAKDGKIVASIGSELTFDM